ncbi:hypothetical protein ABPG72_005399 [Tetrahymena utriculariae]
MKKQIQLYLRKLKKNQIMFKLKQKGVYNVVATPILFKGCNFTGDSVKLTSEIASIDLRQYKSLYVPAGMSVRFFSKQNFQGNNNAYTSSVYCQGPGFSAALTQKVHQQDSSQHTSIQVSGVNTAKKIYSKLKPNKY